MLCLCLNHYLRKSLTKQYLFLSKPYYWKQAKLLKRYFLFVRDVFVNGIIIGKTICTTL